MNTVSCDIKGCDAEGVAPSGQYSPKGWDTVRLSAPRHSGVAIDVCPDCLKKMGMAPIPTSTHGDHLVDLISDIAQEVINAQ